jgi:hypothetical protein
MVTFGVFSIAWAAWFIFADKRRWREIAPVSLFAALLGGLSDVVMHYYQLWEYEHTLAAELLDDLGIYIVVSYLFIQWLPGNRSITAMFGYWFAWTAVSFSVEYIFVSTGHLQYDKWWNMGWSYLADWLLFGMFYTYYKMLRLEKLR